MSIKSKLHRTLVLLPTKVAKKIEEARANGTWLKAPNGKPTNLTPKQWVQVRIQAFKNWFGDWEKAANHQYVGKIELGGKEYYVRFTVQEINTRRRDVVANQLHSACERCGNI